MRSFLLILLVIANISAADLSIAGDRFRIDGTPVDLYGIRVASATKDAAITNHLIAQLDDYRAHGVKAVTVFYMGSSAANYDPFSPDGKGWSEPGHRDRMDQIIRACDQRGMVCIVGIFYQWKLSGTRHLQDWNACKEAVKTVANHLVAQGHRNVMLNIANEQNSSAYSAETWARVQNVNDLLDLVRIAKQAQPGLIVGCGGYHHTNNEVFGRSSDVDVLFFDTLGPNDQPHSGALYDRFRAAGVSGKPMVNVEIFGGWTKQFTPQGVYPTSAKNEHFTEISDAASRPGLSVFFHSNPWCQGPSVGSPIRFDLAGLGSSSDPGIRWYFEKVRDTVGGTPPPPTGGPQIDHLYLVDASTDSIIAELGTGTVSVDLNVHPMISVIAEGGSGTKSIRFDLDGQTTFRIENSAPYALFGDTSGDYHPWSPGPSLGTHHIAATAFTATNGSGTAGATRTASFSCIRGGNQAPVARATATPTSGTSPLTVIFDARSSSDSDGNIVSYRWSFGDGSSGSGAQISHTYTSVDTGAFGAVLTVTDNQGAVASLSIPITVNAAPPATSGPTITACYLVDASSDTVIADLLVGGVTVDLSQHPNISVVAEGSTGTKSIRFDLDGQIGFRIENSAPYALFGDASGNDYHPWAPVPSSGVHQVSATAYSGTKATGNAGSTVTVSFTITSGNPPAQSLRISFQPAGTPVASGFVADSGALYGDRGNGRKFGWNVLNSETRDRNHPASPNQAYDTLIHLQNGSQSGMTWEIGLANGRYLVHVVCGDPAYSNSTYGIDVEGQRVLFGTPSSGSQWIEGQAEIEVIDGRLTLTNANGSNNNKLSWLEVIAVPGGNG